MSNLPKYSFLFCLLVLLGCKEADEEVSVEKPNMVFILVDDLSKEWVSHYGAEDIETPNIDKLAEGGMTFHNFYSMPQCTPTRLSFLTAEYPFSHGWVNHWDVPRWGGGAHFDEKLNPTMLPKIKEAGYKTAMAGKWQIDDFRVEPDALTKIGFDAFCMWTGWEEGIPASGERYQNPYIYSNTSASHTYSDRFGPDIFTKFIVDFIEESKDDLFFVYYAMVLTHTPFVNTPDEASSDDLGKHKAMVRYTDKITGQIVKALEKAGVRDNTIIVWTTDNGTTSQVSGKLNGRMVRGGKGSTKESGINQPFIVNWPGHIKAGLETDALIDITDLLPTFVDLVNPSTLPEPSAFGGKSFKNLITGKSDDSERSWILGMGGKNNARLTNQGVENQYVYRDRVLRDKRFKLCIGTNGSPEGFYDLKEDPFEENNLVNKIEGIAQKETYEKLMAVVGQFPKEDNEPKYEPNSAQGWDVAITAESKKWKKDY